MNGDTSASDPIKPPNSEFTAAMDMDDDRDQFSDLPDELLFPILTFLPTNSALAASSLSHRWYNQWVSLLHSLPNFDFQTPLLQNSDTLSFVNSVNNLISVNISPTISKFRLKTGNFNRDYLSRFNEWIRFVISKSVIELDLGITLDQNFVDDFDDDDDDEGCLRILPCDSLKILKISSNFGLKMPIPASSAFENLRIFHFDYLESPLYRALVPQLFTNLPPLIEELSIRATLWIPDGLMTFNIVAPALKIFLFSTRCHSSEVFRVIVAVDAPLLEKICLDEDFIAVYSLEKCLNISEAKVCVAKRVGAYDYMVDDSVAHSNNSKAKHLLRGLSNAKSISLSSRAVLALVVLPDNANFPIVPFPFLTKLELVIPCDCAWKLLMPMLENSPNLEVLILTKRECNNTNDEVRSLQESLLADLIGEFQFTPPEHLPTCLLLHLKEIEIKGVEEVKVLEYLIENARVLKKLTIHPVSRMDGNVGV